MKLVTPYKVTLTCLVELHFQQNIYASSLQGKVHTILQRLRADKVLFLVLYTLDQEAEPQLSGIIAWLNT